MKNKKLLLLSGVGLMAFAAIFFVGFGGGQQFQGRLQLSNADTTIDYDCGDSTQVLYSNLSWVARGSNYSNPATYDDFKGLYRAIDEDIALHSGHFGCDYIVTVVDIEQPAGVPSNEYTFSCQPLNSADTLAVSEVPNSKAYSITCEKSFAANSDPSDLSSARLELSGGAETFDEHATLSVSHIGGYSEFKDYKYFRVSRSTP